MARANTMACPGALNVGKWAKEHTDLTLRSYDPATGQRTLSYERATPVLMSAILLALVIKTDEAEKAIDSLQKGSERRDLRAELRAWKERLSRYNAINSAAMAATPNDPGSIWWCVTMPLILGWYPNADCTGRDLAQRREDVHDINTPLLLINEAICLGAFYDTQNFAVYWDEVSKNAKDLAESGIAGAEFVYDKAAWLASRAKEHIDAYLDIQRKILPWVAGAVIVGGLAYLAYQYGPRGRT